MKDLKTYILEAQECKKCNGDCKCDSKCKDCNGKEQDCKDCDGKNCDCSNAEKNKATVEDEHLVTFNFADLTDAKDALKELEGKNGVEINGDNVTVTAKKNDLDAIKDVVSIVTEFGKKARKESKNASYESYAQKTKSFMDKVDDLNEYIEQCNAEEE